MSSKREYWQKIKTEWPDLADLLKELRDAGMQAQGVEVEQWPETPSPEYQNISET